jgi:hypothetical protein
MEGEIMQQKRISLPCGCILADKNSEVRVDLCQEHSKGYRNSKASKEDFHPENVNLT